MARSREMKPEIPPDGTARHPQRGPALAAGLERTPPPAVDGDASHKQGLCLLLPVVVARARDADDRGCVPRLPDAGAPSPVHPPYET
jgi:hypothetical protein